MAYPEYTISGKAACKIFVILTAIKTCLKLILKLHVEKAQEFLKSLHNRIHTRLLVKPLFGEAFYCTNSLFLNMIIRQAAVSDIPQIQVVRNSVKENILSNPALVTDKDCVSYLTERGKGWVCEVDDLIVGFAIADLQDHNVWALFLLPKFEGKGIGKKLHDLMLEWYFNQTKETIWLSTGFDTRAEGFYRIQGWKEVGKYGTDELKFEMTYTDWQKRNA